MLTEGMCSTITKLTCPVAKLTEKKTDLSINWHQL